MPARRFVVFVAVLSFLLVPGTAQAVGVPTLVEDIRLGSVGSTPNFPVRGASA